MTDQLDAHPVLVGQGGSLNGYRWDIKDQIRIGRSEECAITIINQQVSRFHAQVFLEGRSVYLKDLHSKNGTYLNGDPVTSRVALADGDHIQIALAQEFVFLSQDATVPLDAGDFAGSAFAVKPELRLDPDSRRVWLGQIEITPPLSALQFKLLHLLYQETGNVVTREQIIEHVWEESASAGVTDQALDALIRRLRERLTEVYPQQHYVVTVRGQGFRLD